MMNLFKSVETMYYPHPLTTEIDNRLKDKPGDRRFHITSVLTSVYLYYKMDRCFKSSGYLKLPTSQ